MKRSLLALCAALMTAGLSAQTETQTLDHEVPGTVVLKDLEGEVELINSDRDVLTAHTESTVDGWVWGLSNQKDRAPYRLAAVEGPGTLTLTPQDRPALWVVGVQTLTETRRSVIAVPARCEVRVEGRDLDVKVSGTFRRIDVHVVRGAIASVGQPAAIQRLVASAQAGVRLNGKPIGRTLVLEGTGTSLVTLTSDNGAIEVVREP